MRTFLFSGELKYSFGRREDGEIVMEGRKGMSVILEKQINGMNLSSCRITQCLSKVTNWNIKEFPLSSQQTWSMYKHPQSPCSCATLNMTFILTKNKSVCVGKS